MRAATLAALAALLLSASALAQPVQGFVDLHSHLMAEDSFGGSWFWGRAEGNIDPAVVRCDGNFLTKSHGATIVPILSEFIGLDTGWHLGQRRGYDPRRCRRIFGITIPGTCPQPHFEHWPNYFSMAHQQMWQGWLQQAHQGGLRVLVVSLADSSLLCATTPPNRRRYPACDEMSSVSRQALHVRRFANTYSNWVGIAETPAQARALIASGKLALVLSVEITKLYPTGDPLAQLDEWRALGVRSVQIAHHADNRFAGAAPIPKLMSTANTVENWLGIQTPVNDIVCRDASGNTADCDGDQSLNVRGLSFEGTAFAQALMDRGMILDVAHLSRRAFGDTYNLALARGYPLLYSHTHMWSTIPGNDKNEKFLKNEEIPYIRNTGGMIGLRTGREPASTYGTAVPNTCPGSVRSFAQSLMYAVDNGLDVGFGADLNGFIEQMQGRYWCSADRALIDAAGGPNEFHRKGLAHVGLLPALVADLSAVGVPQPYTDHLNRSAETFLQLWERSVSLAVPPPNTNLALSAGVSASSTYCQGTGEHCYSPGRVNDGNPSTALGGFFSWTNAGYQPGTPWVELTWSTPITARRIELFTTAGYEVRDYDLQYWNGSSWVNAVVVNGNTTAHVTHVLPAPITTTRLRVWGRSGPSHQARYVRVNELEVYP